MKIGEPVKTLPTSTERSKYAAVWGAVGNLENGCLVPVECGDIAEARRLMLAARYRKLTAHMRLTTIYIGKEGGGD